MSDPDTNARSRDEASDAWLEVHLQEELGELRQPDLRHRILVSDASRRAKAALAVSTHSHVARWLAAAMLLIGIATVVAVVQLANDDTEPATTHLQDPSPDPSPDLRQPAQELLTKSVKEFQQHAATATRISITAAWMSVPISMRPLIEANRTVVPVAAQKTILTELQTLKPLRRAAWKWSNNIRLDLPNGRYLTCAVYRTNERRFSIAGLGDFQITEPLRALLAPMIESVALKTRLAGGSVMSGADLLLEGEASIPGDIEHLTCRGLDDDDLKLLAKFQNLKSLDLSGCSKTLTGVGLTDLRALPHLETLRLRYSNITDSNLASAMSFPKLRELDVSNHQQLTGEFLESAGPACTLRTLKIGWGQTLTDRCLRALSGQDYITHLDLSGRSANKFSNAALNHFSSMHKLESLRLDNMPLPMDTVFLALGALPNLREIRATSTNITNRGLASLHSRHAGAHPNSASPLRSLDLSGCKELREGVLKRLGNFLNLEHLKLDRSSLHVADKNGKATSETFLDLQRLHWLTKLELNGLRLDANACKHIAALPSLTHLNLSFNGDGITDNALKHLSEASRLAHLELSGCDNFGDAGLLTLAQLATLKHLALNTCDGFTMDGLRKFRTARPDCELRLPSRFR